MSVTSEMVAAGRITGRERLKMKLQSAAMKGLAMKEMGQEI